MTAIISFSQLFWKSSLPILRKRLLPLHKMFSFMKILSVLIFSKCIQKHQNMICFVSGDTVSVRDCVYSFRRVLISYNEPTQQEYILTGSDYSHLFGFYFFSSCFLMSWTFFPFTTRHFGDFSIYSSLVLLCIFSFSFSLVGFRVFFCFRFRGFFFSVFVVVFRSFFFWVSRGA